MVFNLKTDNAKEIIQNDVDKKYLKSGCRLGGSVSGDKLHLYIEDDFGKHSSFMSQCFYGKFEDGKINGVFRVANYVLILLIILFLVAVESIVMAGINSSLSSVYAPVVIILAEILYLFALKRISSENNRLICEYLSNL
ncbi:MAG: hypothetical protein J1E96_00485 [Ruminococcus sp.]|nr:hypothetical protein [Ruminococcus sp.]